MQDKVELTIETVIGRIVVMHCDGMNTIEVEDYSERFIRVHTNGMHVGLHDRIQAMRVKGSYLWMIIAKHVADKGEG